MPMKASCRDDSRGDDPDERQDARGNDGSGRVGPAAPFRLQRAGDSKGDEGPYTRDRLEAKYGEFDCSRHPSNMR